MEQELSGNGEAAVMEKKLTKYTPCYKNSDHISSRFVSFLVGVWEARHLAILANVRRNVITILFHGRKLNIDEL